MPSTTTTKTATKTTSKTTTERKRLLPKFCTIWIAVLLVFLLWRGKILYDGVSTWLTSTGDATTVNSTVSQTINQIILPTSHPIVSPTITPTVSSTESSTAILITLLFPCIVASYTLALMECSRHWLIIVSM